ncbi:Alpha-1,3-mannosyl-glycoprotein 2-beta-N-acetylglucosaminyltransferase [Caenorhabditis elegans]|uniref:Alpha-1,3-mannosyl-glycoprotein 2-beta-N-acetylglucosaminyltransferase n=1 Tax=Caenorhabditis elegans TaxID=6239 RepID=G5EFK6_CAEEL|nr:Alpha-1,3-mannosyl-glycoprotein 2-beta-N-acetylglucosaminyltransferase [Caenorhabditis elegans]AAD03024.1 UDP-N-acetylglucosamine:a-3-D-mannoside b-1,2-N-acetylglucosaminyltransferase I [Caenorhabditis elegans]CAA86513.1 Alpha-1,3-mannosyl-glycoprotein 2-beta-N-acetylglucosaminyltransferase [Caenorhabditis elegans]|eukprot:NP_497719.1 GLYcosylation related [Caenorhabditis elegans]
MHISSKITFIFVLIYFSWNFYIQNGFTNKAIVKEELRLLKEMDEAGSRLEKLLKVEKEHMERLSETMNRATRLRITPNSNNPNNWPHPIPVIVFSCNRPDSVRAHVEKLIMYRPSAQQFPITVSQDCDNESVKKEVEKFGNSVNYVKHPPGESVKIEIPTNLQKFKPYYYISRHYKLALNHIFSNSNNYSSVIITEDDLDIAPDFFSYFSNTRYLLEKDPSLWCVTAWNDNGKPENIDLKSNATLYRSDFFAGLGWMMTRKTWEELEPIWPNGFWDDWMREPVQRKQRQCIRPEISRTGMMKYGKEGTSKGQFFSDHLEKIKVNDLPVDFSQINLDYLQKNEFESRLSLDIRNAVPVDIDDITYPDWKPDYEGMKAIIYYTGRTDFVAKADRLSLMHDFKAGVPRTAYNGIVTCFYKGTRIFLVPDRSKVPGYDSSW